MPAVQSSSPVLQPRVPDRTGLRFLVAEDSASQRKLAQLVLEEAGVEVVVVSNGLYAVEAALQEPFDLVLMDLHMPEMGGVEATRAIRLHHSAAALPIVALSSHDEAQTRAICRTAGMDDYCLKPLRAECVAGLLRLTRDRALPR